MILLPDIFQPPMTPVGKEKVLTAINQAKFDLMIEEGTTFFASLLSSLKLHINRDRPTAATDGINLWMNPDFCHIQDDDQILGLMLHEVMHVAFEHCEFSLYEGYDRRLLNIAQDHHINLYITGLGYKIPNGGHCNPKYTGWSSMQIYEDLVENPPPEDEDFEPDVFGPSDGTDASEHAEEVMANIMKAALQAEMADDAGSIPANVKRKIEEIRSPKLPWELVLLKYAEAYAKEDYSWTRPNKRYMPDFYLPCMLSERISQITYGMDVSGSMSEDDISVGESELKYIRELLNPERTRYMTFDTEVHLNKIYEDWEDIDDAELEGGGGTDIIPLLDSVREECPLFAIIFTDGYFAEPNMTGITSDIYWVIKGNPGFTAPQGHGEVIHME